MGNQASGLGAATAQFERTFCQTAAPVGLEGWPEQLRNVLDVLPYWAPGLEGRERFALPFKRGEKAVGNLLALLASELRDVRLTVRQYDLDKDRVLVLLEALDKALTAKACYKAAAAAGWAPLVLCCRVAARTGDAELQLAGWAVVQTLVERVGFTEMKAASKERNQIRREAQARGAFAAAGGVDAVVECVALQHGRAHPLVADALCRVTLSLLAARQDTTPFPSVQALLGGLRPLHGLLWEWSRSDYPRLAVAACAVLRACFLESNEEEARAMQACAVGWGALLWHLRRAVEPVASDTPFGKVTSDEAATVSAVRHRFNIVSDDPLLLGTDAAPPPSARSARIAAAAGGGAASAGAASAGGRAAGSTDEAADGGKDPLHPSIVLPRCTPSGPLLRDHVDGTPLAASSGAGAAAAAGPSAGSSAAAAAAAGTKPASSSSMMPVVVGRRLQHPLAREASREMVAMLCMRNPEGIAVVARVLPTAFMAVLQGAAPESLALVATTVSADGDDATGSSLLPRASTLPLQDRSLASISLFLSPAARTAPAAAMAAPPAAAKSPASKRSLLGGRAASHRSDSNAAFLLMGSGSLVCRGSTPGYIPSTLWKSERDMPVGVGTLGQLWWDAGLCTSVWKRAHKAVCAARVKHKWCGVTALPSFFSRKAPTTGSAAAGAAAASGAPDGDASAKPADEDDDHAAAAAHADESDDDSDEEEAGAAAGGGGGGSTPTAASSGAATTATAASAATRGGAAAASAEPLSIQRASGLQWGLLWALALTGPLCGYRCMWTRRALGELRDGLWAEEVALDRLRTAAKRRGQDRFMLSTGAGAASSIAGAKRLAASAVVPLPMDDGDGDSSLSEYLWEKGTGLFASSKTFTAGQAAAAAKKAQIGSDDFAVGGGRGAAMAASKVWYGEHAVDPGERSLLIPDTKGKPVDLITNPHAILSLPEPLVAWTAQSFEVRYVCLGDVLQVDGVFIGPLLRALDAIRAGTGSRHVPRELRIPRDWPAAVVREAEVEDHPRRKFALLRALRSLAEFVLTDPDETAPLDAVSVIRCTAPTPGLPPPSLAMRARVLADPADFAAPGIVSFLTHLVAHCNSGVGDVAVAPPASGPDAAYAAPMAAGAPFTSLLPADGTLPGHEHNGDWVAGVASREATKSRTTSFAPGGPVDEALAMGGDFDDAEGEAGAAAALASLAMSGDFTMLGVTSTTGTVANTRVRAIAGDVLPAMRGVTGSDALRYRPQGRGTRGLPLCGETAHWLALLRQEAVLALRLLLTVPANGRALASAALRLPALLPLLIVPPGHASEQPYRPDDASAAGGAVAAGAATPSSPPAPAAAGSSAAVGGSPALTAASPASPAAIATAGTSSSSSSLLHGVAVIAHMPAKTAVEAVARILPDELEDVDSEAVAGKVLLASGELPLDADRGIDLPQTLVPAPVIARAAAEALIAAVTSWSNLANAFAREDVMQATLLPLLQAPEHPRVVQRVLSLILLLLPPIVSYWPALRRHGIFQLLLLTVQRGSTFTEPPEDPAKRSPSAAYPPVYPYALLGDGGLCKEAATIIYELHLAEYEARARGFVALTSAPASAIVRLSGTGGAAVDALGSSIGSAGDALTDRTLAGAAWSHADTVAEGARADANSSLSTFVPCALVTLLRKYGPEAFTTVFNSELTATAEALWSYELVDSMVQGLRSQLRPLIAWVHGAFPTETHSGRRMSMGVRRASVAMRRMSQKRAIRFSKPGGGGGGGGSGGQFAFPFADSKVRRQMWPAAPTAAAQQAHAQAFDPVLGVLEALYPRRVYGTSAAALAYPSITYMPVPAIVRYPELEAEPRVADIYLRVYVNGGQTPANMQVFGRELLKNLQEEVVALAVAHYRASLLVRRAQAAAAPLSSGGSGGKTPPPPPPVVRARAAGDEDGTRPARPQAANPFASASPSRPKPAVPSPPGSSDGTPSASNPFAFGAKPTAAAAAAEPPAGSARGSAALPKGHLGGPSLAEHPTGSKAGDAARHLRSALQAYARQQFRALLTLQALRRLLVDSPGTKLDTAAFSALAVLVQTSRGWYAKSVVACAGIAPAARRPRRATYGEGSDDDEQEDVFVESFEDRSALPPIADVFDTKEWQPSDDGDAVPSMPLALLLPPDAVATAAGTADEGDGKLEQNNAFESTVTTPAQALALRKLVTGSKVSRDLDSSRIHIDRCWRSDALAAAGDEVSRVPGSASTGVLPYGDSTSLVALAMEVAAHAMKPHTQTEASKKAVASCALGGFLSALLWLVGDYSGHVAAAAAARDGSAAAAGSSRLHAFVAGPLAVAALRSLAVAASTEPGTQVFVPGLSAKEDAANRFYGHASPVATVLRCSSVVGDRSAADSRTVITATWQPSAAMLQACTLRVAGPAVAIVKTLAPVFPLRQAFAGTAAMRALMAVVVTACSGGGDGDGGAARSRTRGKAAVGFNASSGGGDAGEAADLDDSTSDTQLKRLRQEASEEDFGLPVPGVETVKVSIWKVRRAAEAAIAGLCSLEGASGSPSADAIADIAAEAASALEAASAPAAGAAAAGTSTRFGHSFSGAESPVPLVTRPSMRHKFKSVAVATVASMSLKRSVAAASAASGGEKTLRDATATDADLTATREMRADLERMITPAVARVMLSPAEAVKELLQECCGGLHSVIPILFAPRGVSTSGISWTPALLDSLVMSLRTTDDTATDPEPHAAAAGAASEASRHLAPAARAAVAAFAAGAPAPQAAPAASAASSSNPFDARPSPASVAVAAAAPPSSDAGNPFGSAPAPPAHVAAPVAASNPFGAAPADATPVVDASSPTAAAGNPFGAPPAAAPAAASASRTSNPFAVRFAAAPTVVGTGSGAAATDEPGSSDA